MHGTNTPLACRPMITSRTLSSRRTAATALQHAAHTGALTLLVTDAKAPRGKVKGLPDCQLCLVLIVLADVGRCAGHFKGVKALSVVGNFTTQLQTQADSRWVCGVHQCNGCSKGAATNIVHNTNTHAVSADSGSARKGKGCPRLLHSM